MKGFFSQGLSSNLYKPGVFKIESIKGGCLYLRMFLNRSANLFWSFMVPEAFLEEENKVFGQSFVVLLFYFQSFT